MNKESRISQGRRATANGFVEFNRRKIAVNFSPARFAIIKRLSEKNAVSFSEQVNRLLDERAA